jgi:hypothetical protein
LRMSLTTMLMQRSQHRSSDWNLPEQLDLLE